jgi:hypothetical protein
VAAKRDSDPEGLIEKAMQVAVKKLGIQARVAAEDIAAGPRSPLRADPRVAGVQDDRDVVDYVAAFRDHETVLLPRRCLNHLLGQAHDTLGHGLDGWRGHPPSNAGTVAETAQRTFPPPGPARQPRPPPPRRLRRQRGAPRLHRARVWRRLRGRTPRVALPPSHAACCQMPEVVEPERPLTSIEVGCVTGNIHPGQAPQ